MKNYGPYTLLKARVPETPKAFDRGEAFITGDNLPTLRIVAGADRAIAFAGESVNASLAGAFR